MDNIGSHDIYLLLPELSLAGVAGLIVLVDLIFRRRDILPYVALAGLAIPLTLSIVLWFDLNSDNVTSMNGFFDALVVDKFALFFKFLFIGVAGAVVLLSSDYVKRLQRIQGEYYALVLLSATGMMLLASTKELITIFISLELTSLPLAALAAFLKDERSTESGLKFLILSAISSAVLLYGMVIVYGFTGSTMLTDIAAQLREIDLSSDTAFGSEALLFGIVLIVAGFGFKIASVPFQMWVPDVYEGSPTPITAFLSVASKAAGFAIFLRVFYIAFPLDILSLEWSAIFAILALLSMSLGNFVAIKQTNIKRLMGYSTVAHAGYLLIGLAAVADRVPGASEIVGPTGVLFYLGGYAVTNIAAFATVIAISNRIQSDEITDYAGMSRRAPILAGVLGFAMISLTGIPPTVGFITKVYIFGAAVDTNLEWLAIAGVINSVISAYYYLRVVKVMYLEAPPTEEKLKPDLPIQIAVMTSFVGVAFFGIFPTPLLNLARSAVDVLIA